MEKKVCPKCNEEKSVETGFHGIKVIAPYCKVCTNKMRSIRKQGEMSGMVKNYNTRRYSENKSVLKNKAKERRNATATKETVIYSAVKVDGSIFMGVTNNYAYKSKQMTKDFVKGSANNLMSFDDKDTANLTRTVLVEKMDYSGSCNKTKGWIGKVEDCHYDFAKKISRKLNKINKK